MRELEGNWKDLFQVFKNSVGFSKLLLGTIAMLFTYCTAGFATILLGAASKGYQFSELAKYIIQDLNFDPSRVEKLVCSIVALPYRAFHDAMHFGDSLFSFTGLWLLFSAAVIIMIWALFGGAITRISALEFTKDEQVGMSEALEYSMEKFQSNFMAFIIPMLGIFFFWAVISIVALLANIPYFDALVMLGLPAALLGGVIITFILIGFAFGFPLFTPSLSVEGTDSFDAFSRAFSYVMAEPRKYAGYWLFNIIYGSIGTLFVWAFASVSIKSVNSAGLVATFGEKFRNVMEMNPTADSSLSIVAWALYYAWMLLFEFIAASFPLVFFFCASTMVYLLMRKHVDGIEMEEIFEDLGEEDELTFDEDLPEFEEDFDEEGEFEEDEEEDSEDRPDQESDEEEQEEAEEDTEESEEESSEESSDEDSDEENPDEDKTSEN